MGEPVCGGPRGCPGRRPSHSPTLTPRHVAGSTRVEEGPMIYEVRTYTLRTGAVAEFEDRFAKRKSLREKHSKLGAFWHTDFGPLNQVIHAWPYENLEHRTAVRDAMAKDTELQQIPGGRDLIVEQQSDIMIPAPFMRALGSRDFGTGNFYEMRIYTYAPGDLPKSLEAGARAFQPGRSSRRWPPAGPARSGVSTSSCTCGSTRTRTSATASARNPGRMASGRRSPG